MSTVSVTIPVYNQRPEYLQDAIRSCLEQQRTFDRIIVVDDGSDVPVEVPPGVVLVRHPTNLGIAAALNSGIASSHSDWWCWLSSDDAFYPHKIQVQLTDLEEHGAKAGYHAYHRMHEDGGRGLSFTPAWSSLTEQRRILTRDCLINGSTVMIHRSVFAAVGQFDTSYRFGQDWEYWCRVAREYLWRRAPCPHCADLATGCGICAGHRAAVLGVRRPGGLTETIDHDPDLSRVRHEEDMRVRKTYGRRG